MSYTATYHQDGELKSREFETSQEAAQFLVDGEMSNEEGVRLSYETVVDGSGNVLAQSPPIEKALVALVTGVMFDPYEPLEALGAVLPSEEEIAASLKGL